MNKDQALLRAFRMLENVQLGSLSALDFVKLANVIADEFLGVYVLGANSRHDLTKVMPVGIIEKSSAQIAAFDSNRRMAEDWQSRGTGD